jgi:hypothetical protein
MKRYCKNSGAEQRRDQAAYLLAEVEAELGAPDGKSGGAGVEGVITRLEPEHLVPVYPRHPYKGIKDRRWNLVHHLHRSPMEVINN